MTFHFFSFFFCFIKVFSSTDSLGHALCFIRYFFRHTLFSLLLCLVPTFRQWCLSLWHSRAFSFIFFFHSLFRTDDTVIRISHSFSNHRLAINLNLLLAVRTLSWKTQVSPYTINSNGLFIFFSLRLSPLFRVFGFFSLRPVSFSTPYIAAPPSPRDLVNTTVLYN